MADSYIATSEIRYAPEDGKDKSDIKVFYPGETVSGLPKETMERLLEVAGIAKKSDLERRQAPEGESDLEKELKAKVADQNAEIEALKAKLAEAEEKQNTPAGGQTGSTTGGSTAAKK